MFRICKALHVASAGLIVCPKVPLAIRESNTMLLSLFAQQSLPLIKDLSGKDGPRVYIVDPQTDSKRIVEVARCQRTGLLLIDLGSLHPVPSPVRLGRGLVVAVPAGDGSTPASSSLALKDSMLASFSVHAAVKSSTCRLKFG